MPHPMQGARISGPSSWPWRRSSWSGGHARQARTVAQGLLAVGFSVFSAGCGAAAPPCHCVCPTCGVSVPVRNPAPADGPASNTVATTTEVYASRPAQPTNEGPLSEGELVKRYEGKPAKQVFTGKATYYANSLAGRKTASGERYNPKVFTAAHRKLPFGTVVRVVRTDTNRYVYVRITDRGPFAGKERIIDLSYVAAERLGMIRAGVVPVRVEVLD